MGRMSVWDDESFNSHLENISFGVRQHDVNDVEFKHFLWKVFRHGVRSGVQLSCTMLAKILRITGCTRNVPVASGFFWLIFFFKWGSTLAACNAALNTPYILCNYTHCEPSGEEDSPGTSQYMTYLLSKSRFCKPNIGWFLSSGAQIKFCCFECFCCTYTIDIHNEGSTRVYKEHFHNRVFVQLNPRSDTLS